MARSSLAFVFVALLALSSAAPASIHLNRDLSGSSDIDFSVIERTPADYAPRAVSCPSTPLVRPASSGVGTNEADYISQRRQKAGLAFQAYVNRVWPGYNITSMPIVGLTASGGGYRSLLTGAGVYQGFDIRDTDQPTGGIAQSLSYQAGLSGGSWLLSSLAGNNWPTVTYLKNTLWAAAFQNTLLLPANLVSTSAATEYVDVVADVAAKAAAGYNTTLVDPYGRLLSYQLIQGYDHGDALRMSTLRGFSNFTAHNVAYPIITTTNDRLDQGECPPSKNTTIYEFHPYEYGTWEDGVSAFADTMYMGTSISNGEPTGPTCTAQYDNLGYLFGASGDIFAGICEVIIPSNVTLVASLESILKHAPVLADLFAIFPNPFRNYAASPAVANVDTLFMADGGIAGQNIPIWPFIQQAREVDVLIVNDNSADTSRNYPDGSELYGSYLRAQADGLTRMPTIPPPATFIAAGLNQHATFFGCNDPNTTLMIYLPNHNYTYDSGKYTAQIQYSVASTNAMIANGVRVATQNGTADWPGCLACGIMARQSNLPSDCTACFAKYCYN